MNNIMNYWYSLMLIFQKFCLLLPMLPLLAYPDADYFYADPD